jgi:hypothetical protein
VRLLESGAIPFHGVGSHRRIYLPARLAYLLRSGGFMHWLTGNDAVLRGGFGISTIRERMGLLEGMKKEATRPAGANILQQQAKFDHFIEEFNNERPHEALSMKCSAEV